MERSVKRRSRLPFAPVAAGAAILGASVGVSIAHAQQKAQTTYLDVICHGTASDENPYELVFVRAGAFYAHLYSPSHGQSNYPDWVLDENITPQQASDYARNKDGWEEVCYFGEE